MRRVSLRHHGRRSLLRRYSGELVRLAERKRTEALFMLATHEASLAEEARAAMSDAQAANRAKGEFLAHMSHELRTPLNAIIGFSDMIRFELARRSHSAKILEYADDISTAGWHLFRVISDILDFAKIEAGKFELEEGRADFAAVLESCHTMIKMRLEEKRIAFGCEIAPGLPPLRVDELKLKQVLINLLSNAVKFTPSGGAVTVAAGLDAGRGFIARIHDTGIGIAAADIPKVLIPFAQLDSKVSRKHEGTGLGLPLSKALVELHGGSLVLDSVPGAGTTVTIRLPAGRVIDVATPRIADESEAGLAIPARGGVRRLAGGGSARAGG